MGMDDKAENRAEDLKGKAKETTGKATGNERLEGEGKGDQASASMKNAGEKAKDAVSDAKDAFKK
ncbi:CsbD family protein [Nocardioides coralli]|uniref:CsbD family protein n=1 Tax=Nocardioides coralli TaxID=2872154 RepID=UPI001CA3D559|nr:CsbD family protein [Nocardioides coralli]QZY29041.1 CsbD family protein [Nocardioides coralli]